jgi:aminoglycoside 6'-N-acetyltransferase I
MGDAMKILPVTTDSINDCLQMRMDLFPSLDTETNKKELEIILSSKIFKDFIGYIDNEPAALLELSFRNIVDDCLSSPVGYIEGIYVKEKYRGNNYGKKLVEFAEDFFRKKGCTEIASDAEIENTGSYKFHMRCGFKETYRVVQFKKNL